MCNVKYRKQSEVWIGYSRFLGSLIHLMHGKEKQAMCGRASAEPVYMKTCYTEGYVKYI